MVVVPALKPHLSGSGRGLTLKIRGRAADMEMVAIVQQIDNVRIWSFVMSVSSIFAPSTGISSTSSNILQELEQAMSRSGSASSAGSAAGATSGDSTNLSQEGQLFSQLQSLATTNPAEFKQVTATIAKQLQQAASQQTGSSATALTNLAAKFQQASQTGSASGLIPSHHGHHHGGGGGISSLLAGATATTQAATASYSAQSTNPFSELTSIIQNALNSVTSSATAAVG
jgi:hypothetical protein